MLLATQTKIAIAITLFIVWFYHNWHYEHQHIPLIAKNVITYQTNNRNISQHLNDFHSVGNLLNARKSVKR